VKALKRDNIFIFWLAIFLQHFLCIYQGLMITGVQHATVLIAFLGYCSWICGGWRLVRFLDMRGMYTSLHIGQVKAPQR
jgi:hypothetical protein